MLEVAFGGKFCLLISEKAEAVFPCASVSHWAHFATSPVPARVRLVVFSCPCRDWIQSRGEGNLAVSRDSVRIASLVAALNDLDVFDCDIGNAYLNAPCLEKIWFQAGIECGQSVRGRVMRLTRALYRLKSSGASWRKMFKDYIETTL